MNNRQRFFTVLEGGTPDRTPWFPDITTWYENTRKNFGEPEIFSPGSYIPDGIDFHKRASRLPGQMGKMTFVDFYREYDWGLPVHIYDWSKTVYTGGVEETAREEGKYVYRRLSTPIGELNRTFVRDQDGSLAPYDYWIKDIHDVEILKYVVGHTSYEVDFSGAEKFLRETDGFGVCDLVIWRSPFGKVIHEYFGFEEAVYALMDHEEVIMDLLKVQEEADLKLIEEAAKGPAKVVIVSDHADENLISPPYYQKYCVPFYKKVQSILNPRGIYLSTHLDGNIKGYLPFIAQAGVNLLDGCTPAPMFNYEVEELAEAIRGKISCYLGVPSSMVVEKAWTEQCVEFGKRISKAFDRRVIVNIGDIVPPDGNIEQVIAIGEGLKNL